MDRKITIEEDGLFTTEDYRNMTAAGMLDELITLLNEGNKIIKIEEL